MVDKVDIISAPSKYTLQPVQNANQSAKKPVNGENRKVDWQTIGIAGVAIAAIVGAIILSRHSNVGKTEEVFNSASGHSTGSAAGSTSGLTPPVDPEAELKRLYEIYKDKFKIEGELTFDTFKDIMNSPVFEQIRQMRQNVIDNKLTCKILTDNLASVFGESYPRHIYETSLKISDEEILKDIVGIPIGLPNKFLSCNKATVDARDALDKSMKCEGYSFIPHFAQVNPMTNKLEIIPSSDCRIYFDGNGRYIKMKDGRKEFEYINPREISAESPRLTSYSDSDPTRRSSFKLVETGDENELVLYMEKANKEKSLTFKYNPETYQIYEAYAEDLNTMEHTEISDTPVLSEIAEIFDFKQLVAKDYISTLREMISSVLK